MSTFQAPKGTYDLIPPDSRQVPRRARGHRRAAAQLRLRLHRDARLRERRALRARCRRVHRHRDEGDVRLRDQGRRPARAAPRGHGVRAARRTRGQPAQGGQPAGQALVLRLVLPLRAPPEGPLPALLAGRRRGDRRRGPGAGRRADHPGGPGVPLAGAAELPHPAQLASATRSAARSTGRRCRTSCGAWTSTRTRCAARDQPAAGPGRQAPRRPEAARRRAAAARLPVRRVQGVPRGGPRAADGGGRRASRTTRSWSAASTTTPARPSSSSTTDWARSPRWAAAAATTASPR